MGLTGQKGAGDEFLNQMSPVGTGYKVQESELGASGGAEGGIGENVYSSINDEPEQLITGFSRHHAGIYGLDRSVMDVGRRVLGDNDQLGTELYKASKKGWNSDQWEAADKLRDFQYLSNLRQAQERFPAAYG